MFAAMAVMACSKVAPEDRIPVSENPEGDKQEESVEPKGEGITIQLAQTKVTLGKNVYQFEGNEQIYVKARSGESTVMTNTPGAVNTFTGEFNNPLGKKSDTFDFYFNCTDENGERSFVQNGQPWLVCEGVNANRVNQNGNACYIVEGVELAEFSDYYVALALISPYDCTVDFHSIKAEIPYVSGKALPGITLTKTNQSDEYTKPYFVNVAKNMEGGFYLAVQQNGTEGTMYTSYATSAAITKNNQVKVAEFTPFGITGELKATYKDANNADKEYFKSSYSVYKESGATAANAIKPDVIQGSAANFSMTGISKKIQHLVSLQSLTVTFDDNITATTAPTTPAWSDRTCTIEIPESSGHNTWGRVTVTGASAVFSTPDGNDFSAQITVPTGITRHITGLPYMADFNATSSNQNWLGWTNNNAKWQNTLLANKIYISAGGSITSPKFHIPKNINIKGTSNVQYYKAIGENATFKFGTCSLTSSGPEYEITEVEVTKDANTKVMKYKKSFKSSFTPSYCYFSVGTNKNQSIVYDVVIQYQ